MIKTTLPYICVNTIIVLRAIEKAGKEILDKHGKISCIIFLRECSGGYRVQQFLKSYWQASYQYPTSTDTWKTVSMGLADGKQWMEMLERGESVLDGIVQ